MKSTKLALIANQAFSLVNFRGPLIADLVARDVAVFAFAPDFDDDIREQVRALGATPVDYTLARTGMNPARDIVDAARLARRLRDLRPDVCMAYAVKPSIYGSLAARVVGVPRCYPLVNGLGYAFLDDGSRHPRKLLARFVARRLYRLAFAHTKRIFMQNQQDLDDFVRWGIARPEKLLRVFGTGVDLDAWSFTPPVTAPVTFMLTARLLGEKGVREYVEAARHLKRKAPETRFVLLGGFDTNPGAIEESEVRRWVDEGLVEWPGHVPVKPWLDQASVFVLPSYYREGIPRSIQEALATGRPVITTDLPGCRDTVEDGRNGFLVPARDAVALADAMQRFIDQPELIGRMGVESRKLAEDRFDVHRINRIMIEAMGL